MPDRIKRILLIVGFLVVVLALAIGLYWVFFRAPEVGAPTPTPARPPTGALPTAGVGAPPSGEVPTLPGELPIQPGAPFQPTVPQGIVAVPRTRVLTAAETRSISMASSGQIRGYNPADGKFYRINAEGESVPMSNQAFPEVQEVDWGKSSDKAVITFPDGSNILYNFDTDEQVTLPKHWEDFDFSPQDDRIAAKSVGNNEDNRFLVVANPDGSNARPVESLGSNQDKVHVSWSPNNQMIAYSFTGEPMGLNRQQIILLGQNQENFKGLVVEGRGFVPSWSPTGQNLLYSVYSSERNYLPTLWVSGASGNNVNANRRNLEINTWADKCTWQNEQILICGVPTELGTGAGLQRQLFENVPDEIWKIDLSTGSKTNLGRPQGGGSVKEMQVTPDGTAAVFTDTITGRLIRFDL